MGYTIIGEFKFRNFFGSSPLAWGILHAGPHNSCGGTVHPHSRGVYLPPPPMHRGYLRFIPTRVGYTSSTSILKPFNCGSSPLAWGIPISAVSVGLFSAVHPHSRGVYCTRCTNSICTGRFIPTRVGYTAPISANGIYHSRFIPTRVGYTII